ncbi:MAG TPA: type II toxin-antitoxin system RelE/ParE family toxin [Prolixibacteraceae bacterium]|nr:type II toxin-antitoxin system RelE/ParE family toxin [Prolixibacteraceae bacterium]
MANYISRDSKRYAGLLVNRIQAKARLLKIHPDSGRMLTEFERKDVRELLEGNYRIIYRKANSTQIEILTIHHSARKLKSENFKSDI